MYGLKNILDTLDINILNIEFYTVGREWNYRNVNNPYSRMYYLTEGFGIIDCNNQRLELRPGFLYLIPCFTQVHLTCPDQFKHYYIHFTARTLTGMDILSILKCTYQVSAPPESSQEAVFRRLLELNPNRKLPEYDANKPIYRTVLDNANQLDKEKSPANLLETNALMRLLLSLFFIDSNTSQIHKALEGLNRFSDVIEMIQNHLNEPLPIERLARFSHLNPTYFSNLFSRLMGVSPVQYINKRRVEESQKLLLSTDHTLYKIARSVGFADEYYFSRIFKKIVGISPDRYRKQNLTLHLR
jgi:AraC-like DNA-binding protein